MTGAWEDLVTAATIGVEPAATLPRSVATFRLAEPGAGPAPGEPSGPVAVLAAAAFLHAGRRGGLGPGRLGAGIDTGGGASYPDGPEHPPPDRRPMSRSVAERVLAYPADVAAELAAQAAAAGRAVPAEALALWVSAASRSHEFALAAGPVLGPRGRWLATANPAWRTAALSAPDALAEPSATPGTDRRITTGQRIAWFRGARRRDAAAARTALEHSFGTLGPSLRAALLEELVRGLGPADEAFLRVASTDRAAAVREVADRLLAVLAQPPAARAADAVAELAGCPGTEHRRAAALVETLAAAGADAVASGVVTRFADLPVARPVTVSEHPADELAAWPGPWQRQLTEAAFAHVEARMRAAPPDAGDHRAARLVALRADPCWLRPRLADVLALTPGHSRWRPVLLVATDLADLRHRLEQEPS